MNAIYVRPRFLGGVFHRPLGLAGYLKIGRPVFGIDKPERTNRGLKLNQIMDMIII